MTTKDRGLLQQIGEKMREINPNVWVNYTFERALKLDNVTISDLRRKNEYLTAVEHGFLPIRIVTDRNTAIERIVKRDGYCDVTLLDNESETGTRHIPMLQIENNGTVAELYASLDHIIYHYDYIKSRDFAMNYSVVI